MLLALDIGNTNITCGLFKGRRLIKRFALPANACFKSCITKNIKDFSIISAAAICSVVPRKNTSIANILFSLGGVSARIIGKDLKVPIKNLYHHPKQVGQDRLVNAYAAGILYRLPAIVIDSGTAVTFDLINKKGEYLGGLISPGMEMSLRALNEKTALLPKVRLRRPKALIGKDTENSILSGVVLGAADLCGGIARRIRNSVGKNTLIIGTGGDIGMIKKFSGLNMKIDKDLTLKGINLTYLHDKK